MIDLPTLTSKVPCERVQESGKHPFLPSNLANPMARKIRELMSDLDEAGFVNHGGKGSHRNYKHPKGQKVTLSGKAGADAKPYQEKEVKKAIEESKQ